MRNIKDFGLAMALWLGFFAGVILAGIILSS
jgi:hypothetical protein